MSGVPPYLLKAPDNPEGLDKSVFDGLVAAATKDRYAFYAGFFANFYNTDVLLGSRVSEQTVQASWNVAMMSSPAATVQCIPTWGTDFRKDLARIDIPTLVMQGDSDRIAPIAATGARTSKLIKGAKYVVVKGGPHNIAWTHPEIVNPELVSFLE